MLKYLPTSLYNVPAVETWLSDQSRRGWHAAGFCGDHMLRFRKGPPEERMYRLEPQLRRRGAPERETLALYADAGWEYVGAPFRDQFHLWRSTRPDAREVHTDPVAEDLAYHWVSQVQTDQIRYWCAYAVLFLAGWLLITRMSGAALLIFLESGQVLLAQWYLLLLPLGLAYTLADLRALRVLRRRLSAGIPMEHAVRLTPWQRWGRRLVLYALAALVVCMVGLELGQERGDLTNLPVPPAAALGVRAPLDEPWGTRGGSLLADTALDAAQFDRDNDTLVWSADFYDLRLPFLAKQVLRDLVKSGLPAGEAAPAALEGAPFDEALYLRAGDGTQYLAARLDGRVLFYRAKVPEDLRNHLDAFAAALAGKETP